MKQGFRGWDKVARQIEDIIAGQTVPLNAGQKASLRCLAGRLPQHGMIIADEVGMGKTRIAAVVARAVKEAGGRVAILIPPGLGYQWQEELRHMGVMAPPLLRSLLQYLCEWQEKERQFWLDEQVLLISHIFSNWRLGARSEPWRWLLLPELYAQWRKLEHRWPRGYCNGTMPQDTDVQLTAQRIIAALDQVPDTTPARLLIEELTRNTPWPAALDAAQYGRTEALRVWLERAVGLGLGTFDLVIIDEAHKGRGKESRLNNLLDQIIQASFHVRRLALTATPIELDAGQWTQMLARIGVEASEQLSVAVADYMQAVAAVRLHPGEQRDRFRQAARAFHNALGPYLLRRDKRQESTIQAFAELSGEDFHAYRREEPVRIDVSRLSPDWKQAVCAAESLSFVTRHTDNTQMKRLRLTLANGHGIASLLDQPLRDEEADKAQLEAEREEYGEESPALPAKEQTGARSKREQRMDWWSGLLRRPFDCGSTVLFEHPAILAAVEQIERVCRQGEKVLVFGRFTRPLRALTQLLNVREMLRCLDEDRPWPQSVLSDEESWNAAQVADRQLHGKGRWASQAELNDALARQYSRIRQERSLFRDRLIRDLEEGFRQSPDAWAERFFQAFRQEMNGVGESVSALVSRAVLEILGQDGKAVSPGQKARAFADLMKAVSDHDDTSEADEPDDDVVAVRWAMCRERLEEEYGSPQGRFARLMDGNSKPTTRRFLQLSFNRPHSHPQVLVAQSLVGREGLNLHTACRTVVLLHPEWNPGVVEQQIGRVDRISSLWEKKMIQWQQAGASGKAPRIHIHPVIFEGTYDERHWNVLQTRWNDLRAQLHGQILSPDQAREDTETAAWIAEINSIAPNFSPEQGQR